MSESDEQARAAEVLRLRYVEGLSIRSISRRLQMARKTVRDVLGMRRKPTRELAPRTSIVATHDGTIRALLAAAPEIRAPAVLERLRSQGYTGGLTVIRQRLRALRDKPHAEAFLKLDCVFRADLGTDSGVTWAAIPAASGQGFRGTWAPIPEHLGSDSGRTWAAG